MNTCWSSPPSASGGSWSTVASSKWMGLPHQWHTPTLDVPKVRYHRRRRRQVFDLDTSVQLRREQLQHVVPEPSRGRKRQLQVHRLVQERTSERQATSRTVVGGVGEFVQFCLAHVRQGAVYPVVAVGQGIAHVFAPERFAVPPYTSGMADSLTINRSRELGMNSHVEPRAPRTSTLSPISRPSTFGPMDSTMYSLPS